MTAFPGSVPKYRHHKGTGQAFVQIHGHRHYLGLYGSPKSKERYARFVAELAATPTASPAPPQSWADTTVVELTAAYLDFAQCYYVKDGKPTDHIGTVKRAIRAVNELYGRTAASGFGPLAFRAVQGQLVADGYSRTTINSTCGAIKRMFRWAVSHEMLPPTVYQALTTVPGLRQGRTTAKEPSPVKPVENDVVNATLPHLPMIVADMVRFQRLTGCRPGEVCQLRPMDLDRSREIWEYRPASHKTEYQGRDRVIFVGPQAQALIVPYLLREAAAYCFSPAESEANRHEEMRMRRKTKMQPSQRNRRKVRPLRVPSDCYTKDSYGRAIQRAIENANKAIAQEAAKISAEPVLMPAWHANQLCRSGKRA